MISTFYDRLYPPIGLRALAVFKDGLKKPPTHQFFDNNEDLMEAAATYNSLGKNVYHGTSVYENNQSRKGENVKCIKSIWIDLDVGEKKPYSTIKEAAFDVEKFRIDLGLPQSSMVVSGNGLHVYWHFTKPISPENWDRVAATFASVLDHYGVKHDTSRTQDKASVLRIPGTSNFKSDPPKAVSLKRLGDEVPVGEFYQKLKDYVQAKALIIDGPKVPKGKPETTNKMMEGNDFPPSDPERIEQHCPVAANLNATGGDEEYQVWWRMLGVVKFTEKAEETAIRWSRNRAALGKEKTDGVAKMAEWNANPTTCQEISKHSTKCKDCPNFGKITSPIWLGVSEQPKVAQVSTPAPVHNLQMAKPWEFKAQWVVDARCHATRTGFTNGKMTMSKLQADGTYKHVPFCNMYWQVMRRIRNVTGVWQLEIAYEQYAGFPYKTFFIDSAALASKDTFRKEFAAREIHFFGGANAVDKATEVARFDQDYNREYRVETPTFPTMGWVTEDNTPTSPITGEFIVGDTIYRPNDVPQQVLLGDTVDVSFRSTFKTKGTTAEWVQLANHVYDRPGAEPYQFVIASMFASPLVKLMPGEGEWHGIPVVLGGDSGAAKTSTALAAVGIYAPSQVLKFSSQGDQAGQGDTINALSIKMGSLRNIPYIMDEMTGAGAEKVSAITYMASNGRAKDRMNKDAKMQTNPYRWDSIPIITSNDSLHEVVKGLKSSNAAEAGKIRMFEIELRRHHFAKVFEEVPRTLVEDALLGQQYGCVGRDWIQFVVNNRLAIEKMLGLERERYMIDPTDTSEIRFYKDLIITVKVAAVLAKRKGFIHWDVAAMIKWAEGNLVRLRDSVITKDWEGDISDFVASLHGKTIVTRHFKTGRGKRTNPEMSMEALKGEPAARKATDDRRFVVTANYLKNWAQNHSIMPSTLIKEMHSRGYLKMHDSIDLKPKVINIGAGSTISRPQAPCYEFDYDKITEFDSESDLLNMTNVIQLQPMGAMDDSVTDSVTVADGTTGESAVSP